MAVVLDDPFTAVAFNELRRLGGVESVKKNADSPTEKE